MRKRNGRGRLCRPACPGRRSLLPLRLLGHPLHRRRRGHRRPTGLRDALVQTPDLHLNPRLRLGLRGPTNQLHQWISVEASQRHFAHARARGLSSPPSSLPGEGKRVCQTHAPLPQQRGMSEGSAVATQDSLQFQNPSTVENTRFQQ